MTPILHRVGAICFLLAILPFGQARASADNENRVGAPSDRPPLERMDDPWLPRNPAWGAVPPAQAAAGAFNSIQVNLDAAGLNIVGDAANEPSIAVDPTAPNRMVIGWRQFASCRCANKTEDDQQ